MRTQITNKPNKSHTLKHTNAKHAQNTNHPHIHAPKHPNTHTHTHQLATNTKLHKSANIQSHTQTHKNTQACKHTDAHKHTQTPTKHTNMQTDTHLQPHNHTKHKPMNPQLLQHTNKTPNRTKQTEVGGRGSNPLILSAAPSGVRACHLYLRILFLQPVSSADPPILKPSSFKSFSTAAKSLVSLAVTFIVFSQCFSRTRHQKYLGLHSCAGGFGMLYCCTAVKS